MIITARELRSKIKPTSEFVIEKFNETVLHQVENYPKVKEVSMSFDLLGDDWNDVQFILDGGYQVERNKFARCWEVRWD